MLHNQSIHGIPLAELLPGVERADWDGVAASPDAAADLQSRIDRIRAINPEHFRRIREANAGILGDWLAPWQGFGSPEAFDAEIARWIPHPVPVPEGFEARAVVMPGDESPSLQLLWPGHVVTLNANDLVEGKSEVYCIDGGGWARIPLLGGEPVDDASRDTVGGPWSFQPFESDGSSGRTGVDVEFRPAGGEWERLARQPPRPGVYTRMPTFAMPARAGEVRLRIANYVTDQTGHRADSAWSAPRPVLRAWSDCRAAWTAGGWDEAAPKGTWHGGTRILAPPAAAEPDIELPGAGEIGKTPDREAQSIGPGDVAPAPQALLDAEPDPLLDTLERVVASRRQARAELAEARAAAIESERLQRAAAEARARAAAAEERAEPARLAIREISAELLEQLQADEDFPGIQ